MFKFYVNQERLDCFLLLKILKAAVCRFQLQHLKEKLKDLNARAEISTLEHQDYLLYFINFQNTSYSIPTV